MYRAGNGSQSGREYPGGDQRRVATQFSVPLEGGRSQADRVRYDQSSRRGQSDWSGNRERSCGHHQGWHGSAQPGQGYRGGNRTSSSQGGGEGGGANFAAEHRYGYGASTYNYLEDPRTRQPARIPGQDEVIRRYQLQQEQRFGKQDNTTMRRPNSFTGRTQVDKTEQERKEKEQQRQDEENFQKTLAQSRVLDATKRAERASMAANRSSATNGQAVNSKDERKLADLAASIARSQALLAKLDQDKDDRDSDDELVVLGQSISEGYTAKEQGGSAATTAKCESERGNKVQQSKKSKLGRLKAHGGFAHDDRADLPSSREKPLKDGDTEELGPSLAELYADKLDGQLVDDAIREADALALAEKKMLKGDESDLDIVDPLKSSEEADHAVAQYGETSFVRAVREATPDEWMTSRIPVDVDPSTLCPFCDQPLPEEPSERLSLLRDYLLSRPTIESRHSARNSKAKYLPIVEVASFCQLHKDERTIIPEGKAHGYPVHVEWDALPERIERDVVPMLIEVILGHTESQFLDRAKEDWDRHNGFKRTNVSAEWDSFHLEEPGYYGPRGFEIIHSTLRQLFDVKHRILTSSHIAPFSPDFYIRRILVPETALELIRLDLKLHRDGAGMEKAFEVLESSRAFGKAAHAIIENVEKERQKAREEERRRIDEDRTGDVAECDSAAPREIGMDQHSILHEQDYHIADTAPPTRKLEVPDKPSSTAAVDKWKPAASSTSPATLNNSKERTVSPVREGAEVKRPKSEIQTSSASLTTQPKIAAFMKLVNIRDQDLEEQANVSAKPSSSTSRKNAPSIVIDSSSDDEDAQPARKHRQPNKRNEDHSSSSQEKGKQDRLPGSSRSDSRKRRASSPDGLPRTEKSRNRVQSPPPSAAASTSSDEDVLPKPHRNPSSSSASAGTAALEKALADCSDLESDSDTSRKARAVETQRDRKNSSKKKGSSSDALSKPGTKKRDRREKVADEEKRKRKKPSKGRDGEKGGVVKAKPTKLYRHRLAADSTDSK